MSAAGPLRIVVDTNVLIGALTNPTGHGARVLEAWREGRVEIVGSEATLREAELVLDAPWLARLSSREKVRQLLDELRAGSVPVKGKRIDGLPLKDEGDQRLVEAAADGGARYLVTTDREVLRYRGHGDTEFVTPAELLRSGALA